MKGIAKGRFIWRPAVNCLGACLPTDRRPAEATASNRFFKARIAERQAIGQLLHDGILQDLTVLGIELANLEREAPAGMRPRIAQLAVWVSSRQAALRDVVSSLVSTDDTVT